MENLFILRHAHAQDINETDSKTDFDRKLTTEGIDKASKIASFLNKMDEGIELILSSPYVRTKETAEIFAKTLLPKPELKIADFLASGSSSREIAKGLLTYNSLNNILLVGHAPDLELFIGKLITADRIKLKRSSLAKVSLVNGVELAGELEWLVVPKVVKKLKLKESDSFYQHKLNL